MKRSHHSPRLSWAGVGLVAGVLILGGRAVTGQRGGAVRPDTPADMAMKITEPFTLASVGDLILMRPASQFTDQGLQSALKIVHDADISVGNFEGSISDMRHFDGPMRGFMAPKEVAADVKAMGFDLVNRANNHLFDSDEQGMFATNALLEEAGLVIAGSGRNLEDARAARFLETPKGRIGLEAMYTPGESGSRLAATSRVGNTGGRPGLNALGTSSAIVVTAEQLAALKRVRDALYEHRNEYSQPIAPVSNEPADQIALFGSRYKVGAKPGMENYTMDREDLRGILTSIKNGKEYADFMVATIHTHLGDSPLQQYHFGDHPPDFLVELAHKSVDNGADAFVGHGVHVLRGVEIYKGKPIFYGLGEFFREMDWSTSAAGGRSDPSLDTDTTDAERSSVRGTMSGLPANYESMVALSRFAGGRLIEVRLYPTDLRNDGPLSQLGIPRIAPPAIGKRILERVQALSKQLGTTITIEGNVGVIHVGAVTGTGGAAQ